MKRLDTWKVRVFVSILFAVFIALVLPYVSALTVEITGTNESPDTSFFYDSEKIFEIAEVYGESGRDFYIFLRWTFDVIWPIVYGSFLYVMLRWLQSAIGVKKLTLLPIGGVVFDFLENISASLIFWFYPIRLQWLASITPYITMSKWIAIGLSFIALFFGTIWVIVKTTRIKI